MYIIHLSDVHYNSDFENDYFEMYQALVEDIKKLKKSKDEIVMIITGDLIDARANRSISDSLEESYLLIKEFANEAGVLESNIFITPGNHDITYKVYYPKMFSELGLDNKLTESIFMKYSSEDVVLDDYFKNLEPYYLFYKKHFIKNFNKKKITPLHSVFQLQLKEELLNIVSLNNVWRFHDYLDNESPYGDMFFGEPQLRMSKELMSKNGLKIAFCHYPIEFLHEFEKRDAERQIIKEYDLFLSGHAHSSNNLRVSAPGDQLNGGCIFNYGGNLSIANYKEDNKKYEMSYDLIEVSSCNVNIHHRKYQFWNKIFVVNTAFNSGISEYKREGDSNSFLAFRDILHDQKQSFDEKLISNNLGGTEAPKNTFDLFISPTLKSYSDDESIPKYTSIDKAIVNKQNLIIFSKRETGKSTLLYGSFNKIYNKSLYDGSYPLYIDMSNNYRKNTLREVIFECYPITKKNDLINELSKYNVVILIDNLDLENEEFCVSIKFFMNKFPNMQIICTSHSSSSGRIPVKFAKGNLISLSPYELQPLTSKQIKDFSNKWFNGKAAEYELEVNNMMKVLGDKRITSYPLYVGMLLWLIEEKKNLSRFDQNMIIENFVDKLLEKTNNSINTVDAFDFSNRKEIIAIVAEHLVVNNSNCISDIELNGLISQFLINNKWDNLYSVNDIYKYLISTNILTGYENGSRSVRFRYHSIFDYFMAIRMEQSNSFYEYIINSKKITKFHRTIDIYSSRNRKNHKYVDRVIDKLKVHLDFLHSQVSLGDIDQNFERNQSLIPMIRSEHVPEKRKQIAKESKVEQLDQAIEKCEKANESDRNFNGENFSLIDDLELNIIMLCNLVRNLEGDFANYVKQEVIDLIIETSIYLGFLYDYSYKQEFFKNENKEIIPLMAAMSFFNPFAVSLFINNYMATIKLHQYYCEIYKTIIKCDNDITYTYSKIKEYVLNILMLENSPILNEGILAFRKYLKENKSIMIEDNLYAYLRQLEVTSEKELLIDTASELIHSTQMRHKNWKQKEELYKKYDRDSKSKLIEKYLSKKTN